MRTLRPYQDGDRQRILAALNRLRDARSDLIEAGATSAAAYVRRALKSAEGALRHAERRERATPVCGREVYPGRYCARRSPHPNSECVGSMSVPEYVASRA